MYKSDGKYKEESEWDKRQQELQQVQHKKGGKNVF